PQRLVYRGLALVRVHVVPDLVGHRLPGLPVRLEAPGEPVPFELVLAPAPRLLDLQVDAGVSLTRILHVHMEPVLPDLCIVDGYRGEVAGLASPVVPAGGLRAAALLLLSCPSPCSRPGSHHPWRALHPRAPTAQASSPQ